MQEKLTQTLIQSLEPQKRRYIVHDTAVSGLLLRIEPSGNKIYYVNYYRPCGGGRTDYKLGRADVFTVAQARDLARDILAAVARGEDPAVIRKDTSDTETLEVFLRDHYAPWVSGARKSGTATAAMLRSAFASMMRVPVLALTPARLDRWRSERRREREVKASTLNRQVGALKAALNWGVRRGFVPHNPAAKLESLQEHDSEAKVRFLSDDERKRLFAALDAREEALRTARERHNAWLQDREMPLYPDLRKRFFVDHLKPMVIVSLNTGIRRGALFRLEWRDIDFLNGVLTIRAAVSKSGTAYHVPLNNASRETLSRWREQCAGEGLVFPSPKDGGVMDNCGSAWESVLKMASIQNFRWHDMRHDFASQLVMRGCDLNTVRELMGHASMTMTLRYAHLAPEVKRRAVETLDE